MPIHILNTVCKNQFKMECIPKCKTENYETYSTKRRKKIVEPSVRQRFFSHIAPKYDLQKKKKSVN